MAKSRRYEVQVAKNTSNRCELFETWAVTLKDTLLCVAQGFYSKKEAERWINQYNKNVNQVHLKLRKYEAKH